MIDVNKPLPTCYGEMCMHISCSSVVAVIILTDVVSVQVMESYQLNFLNQESQSIYNSISALRLKSCYGIKCWLKQKLYPFCEMCLMHMDEKSLQTISKQIVTQVFFFSPFALPPFLLFLSPEQRLTKLCLCKKTHSIVDFNVAASTLFHCAFELELS